MKKDAEKARQNIGFHWAMTELTLKTTQVPVVAFRQRQCFLK